LFTIAGEVGDTDLVLPLTVSWITMGELDGGFTGIDGDCIWCIGIAGEQRLSTDDDGEGFGR